ncbi:MAG: GNAT family N-acetyltransferase, partial [Eubacterium sp.]|nr:GNAT family N-acetyltransferase [Eubacterium sp.]
MLLKEYLKNPCGTLSIPYWKNQSIKIPANMKIVHQNSFNDSYLNDYSDEKYFRLIHNLNNIEKIPVDGFSVKTAETSDIASIVQIINKSYNDLSVSFDQILSFTKTKVYSKDLWVLVIDDKANSIIGCGIADFDEEAKEGILEWIQVLPKYRGKNIGKMIVNELLSRMVEADFATVSGKTDNKTNPERLYRSCGFAG